MGQRLPLEAGYFSVPTEPDEPPRLLGSYSPATGKYFFPRRKLCPITSGPVEDCELGTEGELYSWTFVKMPWLGRLEESADGGYGVGQVDLPEGVRVQARIAGSMGDWAIGMTMRLELLPITTDDKGNELCTFQFVPAGDAA